MKNTVRTALFGAALLITMAGIMTGTARADDAGRALVGTWKLTSWTLAVAGESGGREPFGANAKGRLIVTPQGDFMVIITGANRRAAATEAEKAALMDTLLSYAGKSTIDGNRITTTVDISSNEVFAGANRTQVRFFEVTGDALTIRTPEISSAAMPGKKVVGTLTWVRE